MSGCHVSAKKTVVGVCVCARATLSPIQFTSPFVLLCAFESNRWRSSCAKKNRKNIGMWPALCEIEAIVYVCVCAYVMTAQP